MPTVFSHLTQLVKALCTAQGDIQTEEFLTICRSILPVIDKFGTSFTLVRSDINGNITRLETARQSDPAAHKLLFNIILAELAAGKASGTYSDARGLLWLKRALEFIEALLQRLYSDRTVTMSAAASDAYTQTLYPFHRWWTAAAFTAALKLMPSRETFFERLEVHDEPGMAEMLSFLQSFAPILVKIDQFLKEKGLDDPTPV